jgi:hypothetical protein
MSLRFPPPDLPRFTCVREGRSREPKTRNQSPRKDLYGHAFRKASEAWRKVEPLCRECYFRGRTTPAWGVNHIVPVRHAEDRMLDRTNFASVCLKHHDTLIATLEGVAERMGNVDLLTDWHRDPRTRPQGYAYEPIRVPDVLKGPLK